MHQPKLPIRSILLTVLVVLACLLVACGNSPANVSGSNSPTPAPKRTVIVPTSPSPPPASTPTPIQPVPFSITRIDMSVSPSSIAGTVCGTMVTVRYTAIFHAPDNSTGGVVVFGYTVNGGRSGGGSGETLAFAPGQTTESFSFTWSGNLPPDHTYPGLGGVLVSSPNVVNSPMVKPTGMCI